MNHCTIIHEHFKKSNMGMCSEENSKWKKALTSKMTANGP